MQPGYHLRLLTRVTGGSWARTSMGGGRPFLRLSVGGRRDVVLRRAAMHLTVSRWMSRSYPLHFQQPPNLPLYRLTHLPRPRPTPEITSPHLQPPILLTIQHPRHSFLNNISLTVHIKTIP